MSSKLYMIYASSNNDGHPVTKTFTSQHLAQYFTPFHYTCQHLTSSHLNFTQLHFTTLSFGLTPFKFPSATFHLASLHFTLLYFTALLDDFCHTSVLFTSPHL